MIDVKDRVMTDPTNPFNAIQAGKVESKGLEIEFNANPVDRLNLHASFSDNDTEVVEGDGCLLYTSPSPRDS